MNKEMLIKLNEKYKTKNNFIKRSNKDKQNNSCNSCGICHRIRSPHVSSEGLSLALSHAKSLGKEYCAMSFMQRNYGNNFTASLLSQSSVGSREPVISNKPLAISRKCSCGGSCPGCKAEEEAERVSVRIMKMEKSSQASRSPSGQVLNLRKSDLVPQQLDNSASFNNEQAQISEIMSKKGSGQKLDNNTRSFMEERFGYDFNHIRLHTDSYASKKSNELNAEAFTIGRDIFFNAGRYSPTTTQGKKLLAHELTHVVQQEGYKRESLGGSIRSIHMQIQCATIENCSTERAAEVRSALAAVTPAIRRTISAILDGSTAGRTAFHKYFRNNNPASIALRLAIIGSRLHGATIECENPGEFMYNTFCGGNLAYVRPVPAFFGLGNIHICQPSFHNLNPTQRMATLVHEGAHRYNDADDEAYYTLNCDETDETRALSDLDRWDNADSYGCLVQTLG